MREDSRYQVVVKSGCYDKFCWLDLTPTSWITFMQVTLTYEVIWQHENMRKNKAYDGNYTPYYPFSLKLLFWASDETSNSQESPLPTSSRKTSDRKLF